MTIIHDTKRMRDRFVGREHMCVGTLVDCPHCAIKYLCDELDALRAENARLRDAFQFTADGTQHYKDRAFAAETRMAQVEALCNDGRLPSCGFADRDYDGCYVQDVVQKVRAALAGDRPAADRGALAWEDGVLRYDDGTEPSGEGDR